MGRAEGDRSTRVAGIQTAPAPFPRNPSVVKTVDLVAQASDRGARLILFPEAFLPAFPRGLSFGMALGRRSEAGRDLWAAL